MKKIGILTHYYQNKNIGGILQAYALVSFLQSRGYNAEQISFNFRIYDKQSLSIKQKLFPKHITVKEKFIYYLHKLKHILVRCILKDKFAIQNRKFKLFAENIDHSPIIYNNLNIKSANEHYDKFIIGSDQVWNSDFLPHSAYYGEFAAADKKVISYASSSNVKKFPIEAEKLFVHKLQRLNAISVREKTLKEYIESVAKRKAEVVLDPTFLLSPEEWLKIANLEIIPNKKYIFCYFLGGACKWHRQIVQAYAEKYNYEIIHLPYIMQTVRSADSILKGQGRYDIGPKEFITLINNAECIFTDSFHGLAFSINFGKNFYVFNRDDENGVNSMNARITDTLEMFSLTKRHIKNKNMILNNKPIDFTNAHKVLEQEKQKSISWLLNALKE